MRVSERALRPPPRSDPPEPRRRRIEISQQIAVVVGASPAILPGAPALPGAIRSAGTLGRILGEDYGFDVSGRGGILLADQATQEAMQKAILRSLEPADRQTRWLLYFAGASGGAAVQGLLVPAAARTLEPGTCLSVSWLRELALASPCGELLIVLDLCHTEPQMIEPVFSDWLQPGGDESGRSCQLMAASTRSSEIFNSGHRGGSLFGGSLMDALDGWAGLHEGDGPAVIRFPPLLGYLRSATARRLAALDRDPTASRVQGGNLRGSGEDFVFERKAPIIPPATVRATRDASPVKRLEGLRGLESSTPQEHRRSVQLAVRLAAQGLPEISLEEALAGEKAPFTEKVAAVRRQQAATVGALLAHCSTAAEAGGVEPLLHLAARERSPAVRHQARRSLGCLPPWARSALLGRLSALRGLASLPQRWRLWHLRTSLPEGRQQLSVPARLLAWLTVGLLLLGASWRWAMARPLWRWLLVVSGFLFALSYTGLAANYHLDLSGRSVVVRWGIPGFEALPGMGRTAVVTGFTVEDLEGGRGSVAGGARGLWLPLRGGMLGWGAHLGGLLRPADAALATWRWGDLDAAFSHLERGLAAGDAEAFDALLYMAALDERTLEPATRLALATLADYATLVEGLQSLEALVGALGGVGPREAEATDPTEGLIEALALFRDARPRAVGPVLRAVAERLPNSRGLEAVVLIEATAALGDGDEGAQRVALARALDLLESASLSEELERRTAAALLQIKAAHPSLMAEAVPRLAPLVEGAAPANGPLLLSLFDLPRSVDPQVRRQAQGILVQSAEEGDPAQRIAAVENLGRQLAVDPGKESITAALTRLAAGPAAEIRFAVADAVAGAPSDPSLRLAVVEEMGEMLRADERLERATRAVELLQRLCDPATAPTVVGILMQATDHPRPTLRAAAHRALAELALRELAEVGSVEGTLRLGVQDRSIRVRWAAARGLLLLADRVTGDLEPAIEAAVAELAAGGWWVAEPFGRDLGTANPEAAAIVARRIGPYFRRLDSSGGHVVVRFLQHLAAAHPRVLPAFAEAAAGLQTEPEGGWLLAFLPFDGQIEPLVKELFRLLGSPWAKVRKGAADAIAEVAYGRRQLLAEGYIPALVALLGDPEVEVGVRGARLLGYYGPLEGPAQERVLRPLLGCLETGGPRLRAACGEALADLAAGKAPQGRPVPAELVRALDDPEPRVRRAAGKALGRWARHPPLGLEPSIVTALQQRLAVEGDQEARVELAEALAVGGGSDPAIAREVLGLGRSWLVSDEQLERGGVRVLQELAIAHQSQARRVIGVLSDHFAATDEPFWTLLAVRTIGLRQPRAAGSAVDFMGRVLRSEDARMRHEAVLNGLEPLARFNPELAGVALRAVEGALRDGVEFGERGRVAFIGSERDSMAIALGKHDPGEVWWRLDSVDAGLRRLGRLMLLHLADERPELASVIAGELDRRKKSPHPHVRRSAAIAGEMLTLLRETEDHLENAHAARRWLQILDAVPVPELADAVDLAREKVRAAGYEARL